MIFRFCEIPEGNRHLAREAIGDHSLTCIQMAGGVTQIEVEEEEEEVEEERRAKRFFPPGDKRM